MPGARRGSLARAPGPLGGRPAGRRGPASRALGRLPGNATPPDQPTRDEPGALGKAEAPPRGISRRMLAVLQKVDADHAKHLADLRAKAQRDADLDGAERAARKARAGKWAAGTLGPKKKRASGAPPDIVAGVYSELRAFILAHRECAGLRHTDVPPPTVGGYRLLVICGCGVGLRRWVTLDEMDEHLIRTALLAFEQ